MSPMWRRMTAHPVFFKEPVSALTHFLGFLGALGGAGLLLHFSSHDPVKFTGMAVYGVTLAALFLASSVYHFVDAGPAGNRWLRRLDHAAIFLLIAGSYVPPLLHLLDGAWRFGMLLAVVLFALTGIALKLFWIDCPAWLSTAVYLVMGWIIVIPAPLIVPQLALGQLAVLVSGGLCFTFGAAVYLFERPDPWPRVFGHHELWHLFVLAGAGLHFWFMLGLLEMAVPGT